MKAARPKTAARSNGRSAGCFRDLPSSARGGVSVLMTRKRRVVEFRLAGGNMIYLLASPSWSQLQLHENGVRQWGLIIRRASDKSKRLIQPNGGLRGRQSIQ